MKFYRYRSAVTGKFVTKEFANEAQSFTIRETYIISRRGKITCLVKRRMRSKDAPAAT